MCFNSRCQPKWSASWKKPAMSHTGHHRSLLELFFAQSHSLTKLAQPCSLVGTALPSPDMFPCHGPKTFHLSAA